MCLSPSKIADVGFVACRNCWQCLETKVDDWVGRNIAESKTAKAAHVVTLTYGQDNKTGDIDHIRAAVLTYSDVQKMLKWMHHEYPVRYFVVGEYGSLKGRAHWHIILYWQDKVPEHKLRENFMQKHWPHGWSYWDHMSPESIRYACKYLLKDPADENKQGWGPMPSKKPPLGHEYFKILADRYVEQRLSPQDLFYSFPDVKRVSTAVRARTRSQFDEMARPIRFRMHGKTAENFLSYFYATYVARYGDDPPHTDLMWEWQDKKLKEYLNERVDGPRFEVRRYGVKPIAPPPGGSTMQFCEKANCYFCDDAGMTRLWYSIDSEGEPVWHEKISPKAEPKSQSESDSELVFLKNEYQSVKGYRPYIGEQIRDLKQK